MCVDVRWMTQANKISARFPDDLYRSHWALPHWRVQSNLVKQLFNRFLLPSRSVVRSHPTYSTVQLCTLNMSSSYMVFRYFFSIINLCFFVSWLAVCKVTKHAFLLSLYPQAFGLAVVICSWWLHLKSADYGALLANRWLTAPAIVIVSGRERPSDLILHVHFDRWLAKLAIVLGALGCLGAWFEKKAILFLVIDHVRCVTIAIHLLFSCLVHFCDDHSLRWIAVGRCLRHRVQWASKLIVIDCLTLSSFISIKRATSTRTDLVDRIRQQNTDDTQFVQAMDSIQRRVTVFLLHLLSEVDLLSVC